MHNGILQLQGKGIFLFSDPSGAKACLALASMLTKENYKGELEVISNKKYDFYDDWDVAVIVNEHFDLNKVENKPNWIFTGTSHPQSSNYFEVKQIAKARQQDIFVYSFIDHWINFSLRFEGLVSNELPNEIWVVDEEAKRLAIKDGLPESHIKIQVNPYHYYLKYFWKSAYAGKDYLKTLDIPTKHFHILFAPDPFSLRGRDKEVGFSEIDALKDLISVINALNNDIYLLIKAHPLQPTDQIMALLSSGTQKTHYKFITDGNVPELINSSDLIVGMYSNLLLEAFVLNKKVIRYFPGNKNEDLLRHSLLSQTSSNKEELGKQINQYVNG